MIEAELLFDKIRTFVIENSKSNNGKQTKFKTELLESQLSAEAAIVNHAAKQDVDLVVLLGTKGKSGLKKLLLGSVASGVVTYASKPVLVVK